MGLQRKVTGVEQAHYRVGNVALERFRSRGQKERIVLAPDRQERRLVRLEILLKCRVQRDITLVVTEEIELHLVRSGAREVEVIQ